MNKVLLFIARLAGLTGIAIFLLAILLRTTGHYRLKGFEAGTLLQGGMAVMVLACLAYAAFQAERRQ